MCTIFGRAGSVGRAVAACCVALLIGAVAWADGDVSIMLSVDPDIVNNPGGTLTIEWSVDPSITLPDYVNFAIYDPTHTTIIEQQQYPGGTGLQVTRQWTAPSSPLLPDGRYWIRVEYWAVGIGLEAIAETNFELETQVPVEPETWGRIKELFRH